ncbi:MAG: packaged DNA stabilization protein [Thiohalomonadales bacterium]
MKISFGEGAYTSRSSNANAQELINYYTEVNPASSKANIVTYPTPGTELFKDLGAFPIRGLHEFLGDLYAVSGSSLYKITPGAVVTNLGNITGDGLVSMADSGKELCVVTGFDGYIYSAANGLDLISDPAWFPSDIVIYRNRRFIFIRKGTNQFFISKAYDGRNFDASQWDQITTNPDLLVSGIADHAYIWLFGSKSTNIWTYTGDELNFPFREVTGTALERGCGAIRTPVRLNNVIYWLGDNGVVYQGQGFRIQRISTHAIETAINSYPIFGDAYSYTYEEGGHPFMVITFPSGNATWMYDASISDPSKAWSQRRTGLIGRHLGMAYAHLGERHYVGDYRSGKIHRSSLDLLTDNGEIIYRTATSPMINANRKRVFLDRLEIDIESGVGNTTAPNPQVMLTYSDDGGKTWSKEKFASMGPVGTYMTRLKFHNLGSFYQRIFKLRIADTVKTVILDAEGIGDAE